MSRNKWTIIVGIIGILITIEVSFPDSRIRSLFKGRNVTVSNEKTQTPTVNFEQPATQTISARTNNRNENVSQLSREQERELIEIARSHTSTNIRAEAARRLIEKSRNQDVIVDLARSHTSTNVRAEAARKLIEKSNDREVIRDLARSHTSTNVRADAARRLMNWHYNASNYFR